MRIILLYAYILEDDFTALLHWHYITYNNIYLNAIRTTPLIWLSKLPSFYQSQILSARRIKTLQSSSSS